MVVCCCIVLLDHVAHTHIVVSNTSDHTLGVECAYIPKEIEPDVVSKPCGSPLLGRFLTLIRDESGHRPDGLKHCEVVVIGYQFPSGTFLIPSNN